MYVCITACVWINWIYLWNRQWTDARFRWNEIRSPRSNAPRKWSSIQIHTVYTGNRSYDYYYICTFATFTIGVLCFVVTSSRNRGVVLCVHVISCYAYAQTRFNCSHNGGGIFQILYWADVNSPRSPHQLDLNISTWQSHSSEQRNNALPGNFEITATTTCVNFRQGPPPSPPPSSPPPQTQSATNRARISHRAHALLPYTLHSAHYHLHEAINSRTLLLPTWRMHRCGSARPQCIVVLFVCEFNIIHNIVYRSAVFDRPDRRHFCAAAVNTTHTHLLRLCCLRICYLRGIVIHATHAGLTIYTNNINAHNVRRSVCVFMRMWTVAWWWPICCDFLVIML